MNIPELWKRNRLWLAFVILFGLASYYLPRFTNDPGDTHIQWAARFGLLFLILTLIPNNLIKWSPAKIQGSVFGKGFLWLIKNKRSLGISAGILFVLHGVWVTRMIAQADLASFFFTPAILPGAVASWIFTLMLLTSSKASYGLLGGKWKMLHRLVWLALPIATVHVYLVGVGGRGVASLYGMIGFGLLFAFILMENLLNIRKPTDPTRRAHLYLALGGAAIALLLFFRA